MIVLQRIAAASATIARFGAVAALCWIGAELHAIAESARYIDPSPSRQAAALELIAARLQNAQLAFGAVGQTSTAAAAPIPDHAISDSLGRIELSLSSIAQSLSTRQ